MSILDRYREMEQRVTRAEKKQRKQQKRAQREQERDSLGTLDNLERLATGLVRGQEAVQTHALKQRISNAQRAAMGYRSPDDLEAAAELRHAAEVTQKTAARNQAEVDAHSQADRQSRWNKVRAETMREKARLRRQAEDEGYGYLDPTGPLPIQAPSWFEGPVDGQKITTYKPSIPQPRRNSDGTTSIDFNHDLIHRRAIGPEQLHPEESLRRQAKAARP